MVPIPPQTAPSDTTGEAPAMSALADAWEPTSLAVYSYIGSTGHYLQKGQFVHAISPLRLYNLWLETAYICLQVLIVMLYKAGPPKRDIPLSTPRGRIAIVGAGLTGVSSAAHAISHGFEVVIFEEKSKLGGVWAEVNRTSGLQLNSLLYRFHPSVVWSRAFPHRDEILAQIEGVWKEYQLESRTRFQTPVTKVVRAEMSGSDTNPKELGHARWLVNDDQEPFDAVIVTIGTCGKPKWTHFPGMPDSSHAQNGTEYGKSYADAVKAEDDGSSDDGDKHAQRGGEIYQGEIVHSSQLDDLDCEGKTVVVIGSGASGVEAIETALTKGAKQGVFIARSDKWIIPRNILIDTTLSAQPFGRQMPLSFLWEKFITWWNYHGVRDLTPAHKGIFEGTPVVNDEFLNHVRDGRCDYVRGDTRQLTSNGVVVNVRGRDSKPGDNGTEQEFLADIVVLATGFELPKIDFLPSDLFPEDYERPNLYLQNFSTEDWSILMTNSAYMSAIGTVGHFHIGIYTRILLTFLMDKQARPPARDMKLWVDCLRFIKQGASNGALGFFTYMELTIWLLVFHLLRPDRLRWLFFIMFGWGVRPIQ